jgi:hypothetical protein
VYLGPNLLLFFLFGAAMMCLPLTFSNNQTLAHRNGCHRWHSCPSDNGSYVCGDLGYYSQGQNKPTSTTKSSNDNNKSSQKKKVSKGVIALTTWNTYRNIGCGISMMYPANWKFEQQTWDTSPEAINFIVDLEP